MRRIEQYETVKKIIDMFHIRDFSGYQIGKILYASVWVMYDLSLWQKIKRIFALLVCDPIQITAFPDSAVGADIALEIRYPGDVQRADNAAIFNNLYEYLKPCRHVLLEKQYRLNLTGIPKRLVRLCRYARAVKGFPMSERLYLAAQLVLSRTLADLLDREKIFKDCRYLLIFQEYDTISSMVIQNAHHYKVKVISPQHGMAMNRHENEDQLVFDGFLCDYKLVWNDFEREQYLSAGIDPDRIFVVGNTKALKQQQELKEYKPVKNSFDMMASRFGVLLNCPNYDGAYDANKKLLTAAKALAAKTGMRYLVKTHPIDYAARYTDLFDSAKSEIVPASMTMDEYKDKVIFSLANVTGAIFDLIYEGRYVFQYIGSERYPVDMDDIYRFSSPEELIEHFEMWKTNYIKYSAEYKKTADKYRVEDKKERHDRFFQGLLAGKI